MANVKTLTVDTQGEYENLATLASITFTADTTYVIQPLTGECFLREGTDGDGFIIQPKEKVQYTAGVDDLYIKTLPLYSGRVRINIAD